ncbi:MAG: universal stress protein [Cyclobacteriaceae bacterium]|nr:MAG: universal stress protein [Cyclobacteriaceae bacterium]
MKKILVPTDFSVCADNAVQVALEIAGKFQAEIIFQHLHDDLSGSAHTLQGTAKQHELGHIKAMLDTLVHKAESAGLSARPLLVLNKGNDKIENYIESLGINLVVMGSHGATGIRERILGSQTQRVVRHSAAPVLVIKHKPERKGFKNILFATTFHENPAATIEPVVKLASAYTGKIHMLYVGLEKDTQTKAEVEEKMQLLEQKFPHTTFTRNFITTNDPEWGIQYVAKDIAPDAIALTTQLKVGRFMFTHSLAEDLVNHENRPVLVINPK